MRVILEKMNSKGNLVHISVPEEKQDKYIEQGWINPNVKVSYETSEEDEPRKKRRKRR